MSYRGIQPPPKFILNELEWRGGWFPSQCPPRPGLFLQFVWNKTRSVDFASATLDNFELFGTSPRYVEVRFEGGLHLAGRRTVTDGVASMEFFTAGDTIHAHGCTWSVQRDVSGWLRVVPTTAAAGVRTWVPLAALRSGARVQAAMAAVEDEVRRKALWQVVCLTNDNPTETAILNRMRGDAAQNEYEGADAESCADLARVLASRYRSAGNVSGPFAWGHCYSCGGALTKGKMRQRICCPGQNSDLAKMVAEGCKITSHSAPVRYPGVVWTKSRHPPLKSGVQTVATLRNFRTPRRGSRHCLPHPSATVRVLGALGSTGQSRS